MGCDMDDIEELRARLADQSQYCKELEQENIALTAEVEALSKALETARAGEYKVMGGAGVKGVTGSALSALINKGKVKTKNDPNTEQADMSDALEYLINQYVPSTFNSIKKVKPLPSMLYEKNKHIDLLQHYKKLPPWLSHSTTKKSLTNSDFGNIATSEHVSQMKDTFDDPYWDDHSD